MARVLIIDDSPEILTLLRVFFERKTQHEVLLCTNGADALTQAFEQRPELALVDVMMPEMDGYEVVRRLREDPRTEDMGIIILTARGQPVDRQAALQAGADLHLSKPVDMQALSQAADELLPTAQASPKTRGRVLPIFSLRGGVGVTTIAVNLSILLQQITPTILWDLSPTSGHAALFCGLQPKVHWGSYLTDRQEDTTALLRRHKSGLHLLCAPPVPGNEGWFSAQQIADVLSQLRRSAPSIVIDVPSRLDSAVQALFARAARILIVLGDDPPAIQTSLATLQALHAWQEKVMLIRNVNSPGDHPTAAALKRVMRVPLQGDLPHDPNQAQALRRGVPLALAKPDSPFVTSLKEIARALLTT